MSHPEGYTEPNTTGNFAYVYQYKDHLGNIRLSYSDTNNNGVIESATEIKEENNYYPFGLEHKGYNNVVNGTENNHKTFLGQEMNKELGLNWLTFRYRNYDPAIGRFFGIDPVAESFSDISTYQFAHNTPIWKIELEGLEGIKSQEFDVNGNFKNHVVEKNVVVLTQKARPAPTFKKSASANKIKRVTARVNRQNKRTATANASKIAKVKSELKSYYSGAKNSAGESVKFNFNVTGKAVNNTSTTTRQFAESNGLSSSEPNGLGGTKTAMAAVITTKSPTGRGLAMGNYNVMTRGDQPLGNGSLSHEVGHTLMTRTGRGEHTSSGMMVDGATGSTSLGGVTTTTVDRILEDSYEK